METDAKKVNWMGIIPIILIAAIIPIVVHLKIFQSNEAFYKSYRITTDDDFYSYYKMFFFMIFVGFSLLVITLKFIASAIDLKRSYIYIYIVAFSLLSLLSYLLSENRDISLWGYHGRYEGLLVLIGYMFILFFTMNMVNSESDVWFVLYALVFSSFVIGLIGISQLTGHDVLRTDFGKRFMIFGFKGIDISKINTTIEKYMIYATLYHPDYVGSFEALVFPLFLSLSILLKEKKRKLLFGIMSLLMFIVLLGSRSRAGFLGVIISIIVSLILFRKFLLKKWKYAASLSVIAIILLLIVNKALGGVIFNKLFTTTVDTRMAINRAQLQDVSINNNDITISTKDNGLNISFTVNDINFKDSDNNPISSKLSGSKIVLNDDRYKDFNFEATNADGFPLLVSHVGDVQLIFGYTPKGVKLLNDRNQLIDINHNIQSIGFEGKEQLGSSRGYIWSRSLPLLKDTLLIGHGPDTFALYFPQDDYIGKAKAYGTINMIVDKPHDLYLQTAINTGGLSLVALLGIFISYIVQSIKLYFRCDFSKIYSIFGVSIFFGVVGYLAAAFFNDSVVSVAPVFWILLGVGLSINWKLINKDSSVKSLL